MSHVTLKTLLFYNIFREVILVFMATVAKMHFLQAMPLFKEDRTEIRVK